MATAPGGQAQLPGDAIVAVAGVPAHARQPASPAPHDI